MGRNYLSLSGVHPTLFEKRANDTRLKKLMCIDGALEVFKHIIIIIITRCLAGRLSLGSRITFSSCWESFNLQTMTEQLIDPCRGHAHKSSD